MFGWGKKKKTRNNAAPVTADKSVMLNTGNGLCIALGNAQHQGKRNYQEDSFGFSDTEGETVSSRGLLAVLADGMGGLSNGKAVSTQVVADMLEWYNSSGAAYINGEALKAAITRVNLNVCAAYNGGGSVRSGSTAVVVYIKNGVMHWLCVGDSRIYLKRGGRLYQVNEDHDFLNQLLDEAIKAGSGFGEAFADPQKDSLVGCIGKAELDCFDYSKKGYLLCDGDTVLLCSDGVYNAMSSDELSALLTDDPMRAAERIKNEVLRRDLPGQDNLTAIVIAVYQKG